MRNPFRVKKQRQTWEGRPRALTLDDPVFQDWDQEELEFKPKHQKSDDDLQKTSTANNNSGDNARVSKEHSTTHYNHDNALGYAAVAGAFSGGDAGHSSSAAGSSGNPADSGAGDSAGGDASGDKYGSRFENRIRLLVELTELTRANIPEEYPLLVRPAATDYLEHDPPIRVDFLDISAGANDARMKVEAGPKYQAHLAAAIGKVIEGTGTYVGTVGAIATGKDASEVLADAQADAVLVGRAFSKNPDLVWSWAEELDIDIYAASQYRWLAVRKH